MNKHIEKIDRYLKGIIPPEHASDEHRQRLRRQILNRIERRQTMSVRSRAWKIAAVVALICTGAVAAAVVGVKIYQYQFEGRGADGTYHFTTEPEMVYESPKSDFTVGGSSSVSIGSNDPNFTIDVEQTRKDLEEIAVLRQQEARELVGVVDTEVNGHFLRTYRYKYTLSDGRTMTMGEGGPDERAQRTPEQMEKDHEEIAQLRQQGERELVGVVDTLIEGDLHRVCTYNYVLADGREMTVGEADPELVPPAKPLGTEKITEIWRLRRLKEGEFLGYSDAQVHGRTFTFETYVFTLPDGTVVTHAVGEPKKQKTRLTEADWEEFRSLREAGEGEDLGTEEKVVQGRLFSFKRQRFVLSDGTELIWSVGDPKNE
jgi:hypothetical protein